MKKLKRRLLKLIKRKYIGIPLVFFHLREFFGRKFFVRIHVESDLRVFNQVFIKKDYSIEKLSRKTEITQSYQDILNSGKTPLIIDLGANIGASLVWFAILYPRAVVAAFEPDPENFKVLQLNAEGLNVELYNEAIGSEAGQVQVVDTGRDSWGLRTEISDNGQIALTNLNEFIKAKIADNYVPLIVKVDIEGFENNLFEKNTDWIDHVLLLIVELHDWMLPKRATSRNFLKAISARDRDFIYKEENAFSFRNS